MVVWVSHPSLPYLRSSRSPMPLSSFGPCCQALGHTENHLRAAEAKSEFQAYDNGKGCPSNGPGMSSQKLSKVAQTMVMEDAAEVRNSIMQASDCRGEALRVAEEDAAAQWASALENLTHFEI